MHPMNVPAKFKVGSFTRSKNLGRSLAMPTLSIPQKKILYAYHTDYSTLCALIFPRFSIGVSGGGSKPPISGKGRP